MKIGFVSLGCPKNLVDTEVMMGQLTQAGHELTPHPSDADVIVVNTCSFIDPAKQESVDTILEMAEYKKTGRAQKLIVAGCLVERYRDDIRKNMPEVDALVGTNELERIAALCEGLEPKGKSLDAYLYHDATPRVLSTPKHYAYIKIAEGCDHPCTFCVIPQYRGAFRSRRFESVISEAKRLFSQGVREINLIGQDTTCYGEDFGLKDGLSALLARLAEIETDHPKWVRFLYAYPNKVTQKLLDTIAEHPALVKYIDMPLQHASANVLKRMKRGASGDIFLKLIERIRRTIPGVGIRTSMIVGFPGETAGDFEELCEFVQAGQFDRLGVFSYSDEDTSKSYALDGKVDARTIYQRKRRLMSLQRNYIDLGRTGGAKLLHGGGIPQGDEFKRGFWVEPTVFGEVNMSMRLAKEEVFGPVMSILKFRTEAEAIEMANAIDLGLTAAVWTNDINRALKVAQAVQAGYVWINGVGQHYRGVPYGGFKNSGVGREEGISELLSYTEEKVINIVLGGAEYNPAAG